MRVSLATHGGLAAGLRLGRRPSTVDTSGLTGAEAGELTRLVEAARTASARTAAGAGDARGGDAMTYEVTVDTGVDRADPVVLRQTDTSMTAEFAALLRWLQEHLPPAGA
ncbi:hypothetical protein JD79_04252 [Geodermatophilus normandii]|uniref:Uncharacterized protein n=1 Tax=Geodermatophilus normandii TaxID=1137989 RepID=A0A317QNA7_9ACTN|nr:protealysin inhibitor emfourin [Geodermatophilus normandii]PWW25058.1 hypothetical protein JD79_04252 [Geodermatophilus normandii]